MNASSTTSTPSTSAVTTTAPQTPFLPVFASAPSTSSGFDPFTLFQTPMTASSSTSPPAGPFDQRYRDKRSRNNAAVKKCREIKRKHEKETIEALAKEKKKFKELTEEQYLLETEVKIIQELIPYCKTKRQEMMLPTTTTTTTN